jgi:uracil-DNA glycosylase
VAALSSGAAILALGRVAHSAVLKALALSASAFPFSHGARYDLPGQRTLYDSYHCSRYNTQTRRLTAAMFEAVFTQIISRLK